LSVSKLLKSFCVKSFFLQRSLDYLVDHVSKKLKRDFK
jgi:hypothetical protein